MKLKNIEKIVSQVENGSLSLDLEPFYHEEEYVDGCDGVWIGHTVEDYESIEVYFAEHEEVEGLRQLIYEGEADESELEELVFNDYEDRFNYDDVVAYRIGSGRMEWL